MALIQQGAFDAFSMTPEAEGVTGLDTFSEVRELRRDAPPRVRLIESAEPRGLALRSIKLERGFESFLQKVFKGENEVYFLAWCWDLSGEPVSLYPGKTAEGSSSLIKLRAGDVREFTMGAGIGLFEPRQVTAGLAVRINLWESDEKRRRFGETLGSVTDAIKDSKLNNVLKLVALAGPQLATITLVKDAALELAGVVATLLKADSDDFVDFFEGYYPAADAWPASDETHRGHASEIVLRHFR
jgi:hypothetical protein